MTAQLIDIAATLCAAVLGVQMTVIIVVWLMDFLDWIAAHKRWEGE